MDANQTLRAPLIRGFLDWLGLGSTHWPDDLPGPEPVAAAPLDPQDLVRSHIVVAIDEFLATHHLPVTQQTLAIAFDCVAGNDLRLTAMIAERRDSGQPISLEWLSEARRGTNIEDEMQAMTRLMERLESNIDTFARTTTEARTAASEYRSVLRDQVDDLQEVSRAGAAITEMLAIARAMIERTRDIEAQMTRSELETRALHHSLEEARRTAEIDHLTGLPNRRAFEARLEREYSATREAQEPLCVAFCDIDRFKKINDTHGHEAGDRVLKVVARALAEISDDRCHVARHGGEEFVVLFRGKTLDQAYAMLEDARERLADRRMVNRANDVPFGRVTFSAGIANVFDYPDPRAALKGADEALYVAKRDGRNRIVRASVATAPANESKAA